MISRPPMLPPAFGLLMLLGVFTAHFMRPLAILLPYPSNYLGLLPIILGVLLSLLAEREFRKKGLLDAQGQAVDSANVLVTSGVYRFSRNPSFLGQVLIVIGLALWVGSLSPWLIVGLSVFLLQRIYIAKEEHQLAEEFGERYQQYCALVPRWFLPKKQLSE